jgi:hypothetical protein
LAGEENSCGADNYADKQQQRFHFIAPLICGLKDLAPLCLLLTQSGHVDQRIDPEFNTLRNLPQDSVSAYDPKRTLRQRV